MLDRAPAELARLAMLLTPEERERVARFHFQHDADHAAAARGLLRQVLGSYVDRPPAELRFDYGAQGKPSLPGAPIQFNLSHSHGLGVLAVTLDQPVGVDVEYVRADFDHAALAAHSFSIVERSTLASLLPADEAVRGFFRCWTLKEAYIKARGGGLSIPLDGFDVPLRGSGGVVISREGDAAAHGWFVHALETDQRYTAALATRAATLTLRERRL